MRRLSPRLTCLFSSAFLAVSCISLARGQSDDKLNAYTQHNLVSDLPGSGHADSNLVNAWGLDRAPGGPWWVNGNGSGLSLIYDGTGNTISAVSPVSVPAPDGTTGTPTGIVYNPTLGFQLGNFMPAYFLFATEDGTILGWNPLMDLHHALIKVNNSGAAVYKGITWALMADQPTLYAANFRQGRVDVFDSSFHAVTMPAGAFQDPAIPAGFAPFNVQEIGGDIFVTFAMQDSAKHDDVAGVGVGYVDRFTADGKLLMRLQHGDWLNSPWAVVHAPAEFGRLSSRILIGNFGSGQIAAFNAQTGKFIDMMTGPDNRPVTIDGLWGLKFGGNTLFFTAGIQGEAHGLFGTLTAAE